MADKTILNADLYDNVLTEKPGDYTAKPRITSTARNKDVATRSVKERTETKPTPSRWRCHTACRWRVYTS